MNKMGQAEQTTTQAEHVPDVSTGGPCHHYGEGAPLKQINTRASGQHCQTKTDIEQVPEVSQDKGRAEQIEDQSEQMSSQTIKLGRAEQPKSQAEHVLSGGKESANRMEDQYLKAWKEWVERDRLEKIEHTERLEKQEKLSRRWDMIRSCRDIIREHYSDWQERKITAGENREIQRLEDENQARNCKK